MTGSKKVFILNPPCYLMRSAVLETEIFIYILEKIENKFYELIASEALLYENMKDSDMERKERVSSYFELSNKFIEIADKDIYRGRFLQEKGFSGIDSLHIALAEKARADYFITCDDGIIKLYKKYKKLINIEVLSLVEFIGRINKWDTHCLRLKLTDGMRSLKSLAMPELQSLY